MECKADAMLQALLQRSSSAPETEQPELFQKCLKAVLPVCNGKVSTPLVNSSDVKTTLNKYVRPGVENDSYGPFVRATKLALACLQDIEIDRMCAPVPAVDMICQQNDMLVHQTHQTTTSIRKPDLDILLLSSACASFQDETYGKKGKYKDSQKNDEKNQEKNGEKDDERRIKQPKAHMDTNATVKAKNPPWKDVLACIKFKRKTPGRIKGIKKPPSSYAVTDYVPTEPEYLLVDHLKGSSQATRTASGTACCSSIFRPSCCPAFQGGSSSKRKAADTLESAAKKFKMNFDDAVADADLDVTVQTGLYAAEMFVVNPGINYFLNVVVVDDVMWIWYYDRQGIIQCSGINFIQDLPRFMMLLYALQRFKLHDLGRNKDFCPVQIEGRGCHEFKIKDEDLGTVDLLRHTSHDERVTPYMLQGQATNDEMVTKSFWGEASSTSEPGILKRFEEIAKRHANVQDHMPKLFWHHTFTNPTSTIREALGVPEPTRGSRVLYILVFRKLLPIARLDDKELFDVWRQCICKADSHLTLWKEGVHHRDVSPGNLVWYWKCGRRIGIMNDYDLSSLADDPGPQRNKRMSTVPFMALDLFTEECQQGKVKHLYRHDLESFMWCFVWTSFRYENGVLLPRNLRCFGEWGALDAMSCARRKYSLQGHRNPPPRLPTDPLVWRFIVACLKVLDAEAYNRRARQPDLPTEVDKRTNTEESVSDMDYFLAKFTATPAWAALSSPIPSQ
ncbi:uncharacterized protein EDB93DRAFT_1331954 [Suillus bovinus]|uniref:uncharacterized protein n=1 Tax=Suillus bovinus TaxID=48563 RepID=UPI001B8813B0|nr:uncharacterized protein EDB93DRAFT_1331954 [Suillus bovinus]KAG2130825.1 hypothetical protein EDB93DRAFT_1331954 [Suillus bovinus]